MSAVGLKLVTLLCFSCTALADPERSQVVWKKAGETTTIECRTSDSTQEYLDLCRGLCEDDKVVYVNLKKVEPVLAFQGRVHVNGEFPNVDISIGNLTSADIAPYWCVYKKFVLEAADLKKRLGGSVYLVVTDDQVEPPNRSQACETDQQKLLLVTVVISAVVLFVFILGAFIWVTLKTKTFRPSEKPRRVPNNEVYEDMRSTIRR